MFLNQRLSILCRAMVSGEAEVEEDVGGDDEGYHDGGDDFDDDDDCVVQDNRSGRI